MEGRWSAAVRRDPNNALGQTRMRQKNKSLGKPKSQTWALNNRPGFLVRRLYQIHVAMFIEECGTDITPVQYSILSAVNVHGPADQTKIGYEVCLDRTNTADVLARLEKRGLINRSGSKVDRRLRLATLTAEGRRVLAQFDQCAHRAHERTIEALPPKLRRQFMTSLITLVEKNNDVGRGT